jgi:tripartite-type tricarboxylate transporter receptor subunit TctC
MAAWCRSRLWLSVLPVAAAILFWGALAHADYPDRPVRLIVGSGAGGVNDIIARVLAEKMSTTLGQPIVVENRPGGGTTIAVNEVKRASPDGYMLLANGSSHSVIGPLFPQSGIDVLKDLDSVSMLAVVPLIMVVNHTVPVKNFDQLIAYLKAHPGKLEFGSNGEGSGAYLASELFKKMAGVDFLQVPYRTTPMALSDLMAGRIALMIDTQTLLGPYIKAGTLIGIATTTIERSSIIPDLPTFDEKGLKGYEASSWTGLYAPKGTPQAVIDKLAAAVSQALADPVIIKKFADLGIIPPKQTGPAYQSAYLKQDVEKWQPVLAATAAAKK